MRSSADKWDIPFQPTSKKRQAAVYMLEAGEADTKVSRDEVAEHADLPKSTITEVVKNLIDAGYQVTRETDPYRRAWYQVLDQHGTPSVSTARTFPKRIRPAAPAPSAKAAEAAAVGAAALSVAVADAPGVKFKGFANGEVEVSWAGAPGVLFRGTVGDSVPGALFSGDSQVVGLQVHPSGLVVLDLGFMQVRGSLR